MSSVACVLDPIRDLAGVHSTRYRSGRYRLHPTCPARATELIRSTKGELTPFQKVIVEEFMLHGKGIIEIARIISMKTYEIVHPRSIEIALMCAFDQMRKREQEVN